MAAPTYDNHNSTSSVANVSSLTTSSWLIGGVQRYLIGAIASGAGTPVNPTGMRWKGSGGTVMSIQGSTLNVGGNGKLSLFKLLAPDAESNTLFGNWPSAQDETAIGAISTNGVDQSTPVRGSNSASGSDSSMTPTVTVTTVADDLVIDCVWYINTGGDGRSLSAAGGQTARVNINLAGGFESFAMSHKVATGTSTTMTWTISGTAVVIDWGIIAIVLQGAAGAPEPSMGKIIKSILRPRIFAPGVGR